MPVRPLVLASWQPGNPLDLAVLHEVKAREAACRQAQDPAWREAHADGRDRRLADHARDGLDEVPLLAPYPGAVLLGSLADLMPDELAAA